MAKDGKLSPIIIIYVCEFVFYLTVTSYVNIRTLCVTEWRVSMTIFDPGTELIFPHTGSVEIIARHKLQQQHAFANETKKEDWEWVQEAPAAVENTHIKGVYRPMKTANLCNSIYVINVLNLILKGFKYYKIINSFSIGWVKVIVALQNVQRPQYASNEVLVGLTALYNISKVLHTMEMGILTIFVTF